MRRVVLVVALLPLVLAQGDSLMPHIKPMPLQAAAVSYPEDYSPPPFPKENDADMTWELAQRLEQYYKDTGTTPPPMDEEEEDAGPDVPLAVKIHEHLLNILHTSDDVNDVMEDILDECSKIEVNTTSSHELEQDEMPPEAKTTLRKLESDLDVTERKLAAMLQHALELTEKRMELVMEELRAQIPEAKEKAPQLYDAYPLIVKREMAFWLNIIRNLKYHFQREERAERYKSKKFKFDIKPTTKLLEGGKRDKTKLVHHGGRTIRAMHNVCLFEQTHITNQLPLLYPAQAVMPVSAHTACWCEGILHQADQFRSGMLDYYYNNYHTLRHCQSAKCVLCPMVYEAIWMDLEDGLNPGEICKQWASQNYFIVNLRPEEAEDQCIRMANGFVMSAHGLMTKTAEVFGDVEVLKRPEINCDEELEAMKKKLSVLSSEACKAMDCCSTGVILSKKDIAEVKESFTSAVNLPPGTGGITTEPPEDEINAKREDRVKKSTV